MRKTQLRFFYVLFLLVLMRCLPSAAQVATGTPPLGSFGGGPDVINLGNLNAHLSVPVLNKGGRGMPFYYNLTYDSSVWYPVTSGSTTSWQPVNYWGWGSQTAVTTGYVNYQITSTECYSNGHIPTGGLTTYRGWTYTDQFGVTHAFVGESEVEYGTCGSTVSGMNAVAMDGSGYRLQSTSGDQNITITSRGGKVINPPFLTAYGAGTATDRNGNQITVSTSGVFTDTLGQTALTVSQGAPGPTTPTTFTYTAPSGANAVYTMKYAAYNIETNFGCSGITEYSASSIALVSEIDLPDEGANSADKYTFTYEPTPGHTGYFTGRLASVTLPTGGTISYTYTGSNNGIECSDGSTAGLNRTVNPGGEWQYTRSGSGSAWATTITDPQNNETAINFQEESTSHNFYETMRSVYQGSNVLAYYAICYNGSTGSEYNCNSVAITLPITEREVISYLPPTANLQSQRVDYYNSNGLVYETDERDYGPGAPGALLRKTLTTYASLGNGIVSMPATIAVQDGSGNVKSQTTYTYDQGGVTSTSGTPQHVAVSGSRGNATTVSRLVQGSTTLSKTYTYYDTGTVNTATDVNGAVTTYTYGSGTSCGNSFATSVSEPMSLSRSMAWNCTGGVQTSLTDENGQPTTTTYSDAYFWRANQAKDAAANVANFTYDAAISVEGAVVFGSSTTDALTTVDGLGRPHISQIKESPTSSTYDSVETDYDSDGRPSRTTLPYAANASTTNSTAPGTTTTYDALGRKLQVTDSAGKIVTYSYSQNDTYRTVGPAPAGENTKRKQFEYDGLGRLTSVCEVTSATGSASCAQNTAATGYLTQYFYDALNNLTSVVQNAQSASKQTRIFNYDGLSRLTSETTPEAGTVTYQYDTSSICWGGSYNGDLTVRTDNAGNVTCSIYDQLHRVTDVAGWKNNAWYSGNGPCRRFRYDATSKGQISPPSGSNLTNLAGRLMEVETDGCTTGVTITDEWFGYTVLGQPSDVYESTPHSGGYYHVNETYWANGTPNKISGLTGLPAITYGVDGEGRVASASASSGQNPLTSALYTTASLPYQVTLGSSDSDLYTFDSKSNRMTQYKFSVNGEAGTGTLTWNPIGTLETLAVTDQFYGPGNQTCSYTHDDMSRIASANCGSPWNQTFSYDAFGNISKSGTISFQPTYSYLTNRMTQIGSSTPTYDTNGNVLSDTAHTYTWDEYGKPLTIDSVALTYDALGRMVEQNRSNVFTEIVYSPTGSKQALMSGTTLQKAFVPLAGSTVAVYNSSGLAYYRHSDWLGSSRLASTPSRTIYYDVAYGPFGESYAQTGSTDLSFTGMNQDTVTNLFDFPAREYNDIHGRWPSPDPAGLSSVRPFDPQTLNRYAYVRNSPLSHIDPTGMHLIDCGDDGNDDCGGGEAEGGGGDGGGVDGGGGSGGCDPMVDPTCGVNGTPTPGPSNPPNLPYDGCTPGDFSCDPFSNDGCDNAYSGTCESASGAFQSTISGDPCVYTNEDGTYNEDPNSSRGECKQTGGVWVPSWASYGVDSNGNVTIFEPCSDQLQPYLAACTTPWYWQFYNNVLHILRKGQRPDNGGGGVVGSDLPPTELQRAIGGVETSFAALAEPEQLGRQVDIAIGIREGLRLS
jgi:RHS repeat-associated protein